MDEKDVFSEMSRQPLAGRVAVTEIAAVLIVDGNAAADRFQRYPGEGCCYGGVALDVPCRHRAVGVFRCKVAVDAFGGDAAEAGLGVGVAADVGDGDRRRCR